MFIKKILSLSLVLAIVALLLIEGLYYFNFSPFSLINYYFLGFDLLLRWIFSYLLILGILLLIGLIVSIRKNIIKNIGYQLVNMLVIFMIINFILKFSFINYSQMTLLGQISLFFVIIFVFRTFYYSIMF